MPYTLLSNRRKYGFAALSLFLASTWSATIIVSVLCSSILKVGYHITHHNYLQYHKQQTDKMTIRCGVPEWRKLRSGYILVPSRARRYIKKDISHKHAYTHKFPENVLLRLAFFLTFAHNLSHLLFKGCLVVAPHDGGVQVGR